MPPLPTHSRPTSNCGLTRATSQAPGAARLSAAGRALVRLMKLTSATMAPTGPATIPASRRLASVPSSATTLGSLAELGVKLVAPDIDGEDAGSAALEQHLGEASGRGANIERDEALRVEAEGVQRRCELEPAAGDEGRRLGVDDKAGAGIEQRPRLQRRHALDAHRAEADEVGGARAGRRPDPCPLKFGRGAFFCRCPYSLLICFAPRGGFLACG